MKIKVLIAIAAVVFVFLISACDNKQNSTPNEEVVRITAAEVCQGCEAGKCERKGAPYSKSEYKTTADCCQTKQEATGN